MGGHGIQAEKELVEQYKIPYFTIISENCAATFLCGIFDVIKIMVGFFNLYFYYGSPDLLVTIGGFVSVPLHFAAFALGIPTWVHQQDSAGLANRLMSRVAKKLPRLRETQKYFNEKKPNGLAIGTRFVGGEYK